jgi:1-acyl-sn-glycerol-3-phosphate acyltransferase
VPSATERADAAPGAAGVGPQPLAGRGVTLRGSRLARLVLRLLGWELVFDGLPAAQGVAAVYPHTSNWDFVVGLLAKWAIGIPVTFWGKHTLFRVPVLGWWMRWLGGVPVDRRAPQGLVAQAVAAMRAAREQGRFQWVALAPEGTRRAVPGWRSGFYAVAHGAQVPLALVVLDFGSRRIGFDSFWRTSGNAAADMAVFAQRLAGVRGCRPARAAPVRLLQQG